MTTTTTTSPLVLEAAPTAKQKKYDRQLRLWAASGQQALEESHILLLNSGPGVVGVETLKNLVLPGVGNFTILDPAVVNHSDLGVNFFLEESSVGSSRAEECCKFLKELNPDVEGHFIADSVESFLEKPDALNPYSLVLVASPIDPEVLSRISQHASATSTPLFYLHSVGFYSHFSLQLPTAFPIVDTHPDPETTTDLRLLKPWPELVQLAEEHTSNLDQMDDEAHGHVPYLLLLLHYLERWKSSHDGNAPQNYKEKNEFKKLVTAAARISDSDGGGEENYDEAVAAVLKNFNLPEPRSSVKDVFRADECQNPDAHSASFWIIANAISEFYRTAGVLPLPGAVPDMKAKSADYIKLQTVYKQKARDDVAQVLCLVRELERKLQRKPPIEQSEVEAFCKNAAHVKLVRGRPLCIAHPGLKIKWADRAKSCASALSDPDSGILQCIAFLAYDSFRAARRSEGSTRAARAPGEDDEQGFDATALAGIAHALVEDLIKEAETTVDEPDYSDIKERVAQITGELVHAGGGELHNISALTGGLVSQEVIKVVTKQYVPVDNVCLFDGVHSKAAVLRL